MLKWDWNKKIGMLEIEQNGKEFVINVYRGNAFAIFLNEWTNEEGKDVYLMYNFFVDKEHFKNCANDKEWNYAGEWKRLTLWDVPNDLWLMIKDLQKKGVEIILRSKQ